MKKLILIALVLTSLPVFAFENISCAIDKYKHEGKDELALTQTVKVQSFTANNQGVKTETSWSTSVLWFWPTMHAYGISELERNLAEYECKMDPKAIKCELIEEGEDCHKVLRLTRANGKIIHTLPHVKNVEAEKVLADFIKTGICH